MKLKSIILIFTVIFLSACVTTQPVNKKGNYSMHYNPVQSSLHPEYLILQESPNKIRLYFKLNTRELRFSKANSDAELRAEIKISFLVAPSFTDKTIIDSASQNIKIKYNKNQKELVTFFELNTEQLENFIVYTKIKDKYSGKQSKHFTRGKNIKKDNKYQYILKYINGKPIFKSFINIQDTITVKHTNHDLSFLHVKYYSKDFEAAKAPFNTAKADSGKLVPDSVYKLPVKNWQSVFVPYKTGLYRFQSDTSEQGGILLFVGHKDYPNYTLAKHLTGPIRYLTTTAEYDSITTSDNKKLEIDKFWINTTGNYDKARHLIRIWYTRAKYSNLYFSSYKEGWKTDRGMIYIMFGPPDILNYTNEGERWFYRSKANNGIEFIFKKQNTNISSTDFSLIRSSKYSNFWYSAAKSWRSGTIYE